MRPEVIFFLAALSFLSGILSASFGLSLSLSLIPAAVLCAFLYIKNVDLKIVLITGVLFILGSGYFAFDAYRYQSALSHVPSSGAIAGTISNDPKIQSNFESFVLDTSYGKIAVTTNPTDAYFYGDSISINGTLSAATSYERSQGILDEFRKPDIIKTGTNSGNPILAFLYGIKHSVHASYQKLFPPQQSALLYGIIFGANEDFSPAFLKNLELSGLRFITAIDGLHMQLVILILFAIVGSLLPRRFAFIATFIFVVCFIALTGFTVSGIRAAIMAFVAGFARESKRSYVPYNAIALVAVILAFINPQVLWFDAGFQLSFLAVVAIVYLLPALRAILRIGDDAGFLGWKECLLITLSVQLATAPVVIAQFQTFSLVSFIASVFVVWMLPSILIGGFAVALLSFLFFPLATLLSFLVGPILEYVTLAVNVFAKIAVSFNPQFGFFGITAYYTALVLFVYWFYATHGIVRGSGTAATPAIEPSGYTITEIE